jgi:Uma2 family endonuclease
MNLLPLAPMTAEEFLGWPEADFYELVDGIPVDMHMGAESSYIGGILYCRIQMFLFSNPLGWAFPPDTSYQCLPDRPNVVRKPDASFVRRGRFPNEQLPLGHIRLAPDLAVEVVSPNDLYYEVEEKVAEYRRAGILLMWIVSPPTRNVLIRRGDGTCGEVSLAGELSGEQVLPGFTCRVADLFPHIQAASPTP